MIKVAIGVAVYGPQFADWWSRLARFTGTLHKYGVDFAGILTASSMLTDNNRNLIAKSFLDKTDAEWLLWIDADTRMPPGGLKRLLEINKTLVSALYYAKYEPYQPIAYERLPTGMYRPLQEWERGEIVPVDAAGMGACLSHRSVFEDIKANYRVFKNTRGAIYSVHKDDIEGKMDKSHPHDGKVYKGQLRERLVPYDLEETDDHFPFFLLEHRRTEDMWFFETAARVGHKCWVDTSVECGHMRDYEFTGEHYRANFTDRYVTKIPGSPKEFSVEILNEGT